MCRLQRPIAQRLRHHEAERSHGRIARGDGEHDGADYGHDAADGPEQLVARDAHDACRCDSLHLAVNLREVRPAAVGHLHRYAALRGADAYHGHGGRGPHHRHGALEDHHVVERRAPLALASHRARHERHLRRVEAGENAACDRSVAVSDSINREQDW